MPEQLLLSICVKDACELATRLYPGLKEVVDCPRFSAVNCSVDLSISFLVQSHVVRGPGWKMDLDLNNRCMISEPEWGLTMSSCTLHGQRPCRHHLRLVQYPDNE